MKNHTTFKIGGHAKIFILPADKEDVQQIILYCLEHKIPWYVIGNGSNILVRDQGISGIVIKISRVIEYIDINGQQIKAGAGIFLPTLARKAARSGLTGLEWAIGIPGSLGGAIVQNAGSLGYQIGNVIKNVTVLNQNGEIKNLKALDLNFRYRTSIFKQDKQIILEAELELKQGNRQKSEAQMTAILKERRHKFPLEYPNAGSIFKNPQELPDSCQMLPHHAAQLIELSGCKGLCCGDAQVSLIHANFIINKGKATFKDVIELMNIVQDKVFLKFKIKLEHEIVIIS